MKLLLQVLTLIFNRIEDKIKTVQNTANDAGTAAAKAQSTAANAQNTAVEANIAAAGKLDRAFPEGEGAFSLNRAAGSAVGEFSVATGFECIASGKYSHAHGYKCEASYDYAHAEGSESKASGLYAHAENVGCHAMGAASHAEGWRTVAQGLATHAEGRETKAASGQHVQGKFNIVDGSGVYAHIVGNGEADNKRSNAHTLDWDGNAWFAGSIEGTSIILRSSTEGSSKRFLIAVDDSGTLSAAEIT